MQTKQTYKLQGEVVELRFLARAAELGLRISKPYGDSAPYDFFPGGKRGSGFEGASEIDDTSRPKMQGVRVRDPQQAPILFEKRSGLHRRLRDRR